MDKGKGIRNKGKRIQDIGISDLGKWIRDTGYGMRDRG